MNAADFARRKFLVKTAIGKYMVLGMDLTEVTFEATYAALQSTGSSNAEISQDIAAHLQRVFPIVIHGELSHLEERSWTFLAAGMTYKMIAERLGVHVKAVDNAIQRVRAKATFHSDVPEAV